LSELVVRGRGGSVDVTPASAGWSYVGFEVLRLTSGASVERPTAARELCVVMLGGRADVVCGGQRWTDIGSRESVFGGRPDAVYLPPGDPVTVTAKANCEVALCWARARRGAEPTLIKASDVRPFTRGSGRTERTIHNILMEDRSAESLLVTEVLTPAGHWSSYPPHKHDRDAPPEETLLEETYYHRIRPAHGFGLQRVYTEDRELDESVAFGDGDVVLVPRGYHTVSAPPGYELYYLNVMAGPRREWRIQNDPEHEWLLSDRTSTTS
jgi:5-deoxy-glucuronate isomerase